MKTATARRMSAEDTLALWQQYKATGDRKLRDRLVLTFAPLVKYIVYKKAREMPARCEVEDFISCGLEALIASIDRFEEFTAAYERFFSQHPRPTRTTIGCELAEILVEIDCVAYVPLQSHV